MKIKDGVQPVKVAYKDGVAITFSQSPHIVSAMHKADLLSKRLFRKEIFITSILDGRHSDNSKHYTGEAFDLRRWIYDQIELKCFVRELAEHLGPDYDVVLEKTHIHVEYDPK